MLQFRPISSPPGAAVAPRSAAYYGGRFTIVDPTDGCRIWAADVRSLGIPLPDRGSRYSRVAEYAVSPGGKLFRVTEGQLHHLWWPAQRRWVVRFYGYMVGYRYKFMEWKPRGVDPYLLIAPSVDHRLEQTGPHRWKWVKRHWQGGPLEEGK